jgi:ectoine hydroxylase-related dioxygenase (phytanoyl-CoA dioxygenase family)
VSEVFQRSLDSEEVAAFRDNGVAKISGCVDSSWINELLRVAEQQVANPSKWVNDVNAGASENRLFTDRYLWRHNDVIHRFVHDSGCARLAAQAMGSNSARFYFDHLLIKKVNTPTITPWHQDAPYWPFRGKQIASIWLALTPVTVEGSGMEFIRGSHLDDVYYLPEVFGGADNKSGQWANEQRGVTVPDIDANREEYDIVSFDMVPGDALIFSAWILHGARGNSSSTQDRVALSTRWLGDDVLWDPREGVDPTVDPAQVLVDPGMPPRDNSFFPEIFSACRPFVE